MTAPKTTSRVGPQLAREVGMQRRETRRPCRVCRILLRVLLSKSRGESFDFLLRLLHPESWLEPADRAGEHPDGAVRRNGKRRRGETRRDPDLNRLFQGPPGMAECGRHHADDRIRDRCRGESVSRSHAGLRRRACARARRSTPLLRRTRPPCPARRTRGPICGRAPSIAK